MKYGKTLGKCLFRKGTLMALPCAAVLTLSAADTTQWNGGGGADTNWNTAANWSAGVPTSNHYAKFSDPYAEPIGVAVDDTVDVYAFQVSGSRTADVTLSGPGTIKTHRSSAILSGGTGRVVFDVDVVNASSGAQSIQGNGVFRKKLDIGTAYNFNLGDANGNKATVSLEDNAVLTATNLYIYADSALSMTGSSVLNYGEGTLRVYKPGASLNVGGSAAVTGKYMELVADSSIALADNASITLTRDLTVNPGGSISLGGNSVFNLRRFSLPLSRTEGVDDGWTMDGGTFRSTATDG